METIICVPMIVCLIQRWGCKRTDSYIVLTTHLESEAFDAYPLSQPDQHWVDEGHHGDECKKWSSNGRQQLDGLRRSLRSRLNDVSVRAAKGAKCRFVSMECISGIPFQQVWQLRAI